MPAVPVPDLKRKFALLRSYPQKRTWPELAEPFDRDFKTLQAWQDGKAGLSEPDRLPDWAVPIFARLIAAALPGARTNDEVRAFMFGPAASLEEEVKSGIGSSMMMLIARDGVTATASLIRRTGSIELIEIEKADAGPHSRIALGEWFRIVVRRRREDSYILALQHTQSIWATVPTGLASAEPRAILLPGLDASGEPAFMRERRDPGRHLFICLETPDPPPAPTASHGREEIIYDKRALDTLAAFFEAQPADRRACHLLEVEIEAQPE